MVAAEAALIAGGPARGDWKWVKAVQRLTTKAR
jgi:hypothetical protein